MSSGQLERQTPDVSARLFEECQAFDIDVDAVVSQGLERDVCADIAEAQVAGIELRWCWRYVPLVITNRGTAHDKRVDAQVQRRMTGGVVGCQCIEYELEVGGA